MLVAVFGLGRISEHMFANVCNFEHNWIILGSTTLDHCYQICEMEEENFPRNMITGYRT